MLPEPPLVGTSVANIGNCFINQMYASRRPAVGSSDWLGLLCCIKLRVQPHTTERTKAKLRRHREKISKRVQRKADLAAAAWAANAVKLIKHTAYEHEKPEQRDCNEAVVGG